MRVDFSLVDDLEDYSSIPEGTYVCRIVDVRVETARDGQPRWGLRLEVADGDYAGRTAAWDSLYWSERGLPRVKRVLAILGHDVTGDLEVDPKELLGARLRAELQMEEHEDPRTGRRISRLKVPFRGYEAVDDDEETPF